jgi:hypothetical protein
VGIGELTKQFAKEAISEQVKDVLGAPPPESAASPAPDSLTAILMGQVQAMQNALKEDQELIVFATMGLITIRVHELFAPSPKVLVLTGTDTTDRSLTRLISPAEGVQLACKPAPMPQGAAKGSRIRFVTPQPAKTK